MEKILNYQASFFGSFSNIKFTQENLTKYTSVYKDFSVNAVPITAIDVRTNKLITDNRIQLVSKDKQYYITILPERIDFSYNLIQGNPEIIDFNQLKTQLSRFIEIFSKIEEGKGNRLANSCNFLSKPYSGQDILNEIKKYSSPDSFFDDEVENLVEWQLRENNRNKYTINSLEEENNNIVSLALVIESETSYRFLGTIDINTNPRNVNQRFTLPQLIEYVEQSSKQMNNCIKKINHE